MENEKTCQKRKCFIAEFPFLDNFRLLAEVDRQTGEQKLIVMYVDSRGRLINVASSGCIDTVVAIPKSVKSIKLSPKDRFISFKSWLAGITEAGLNGFFIQQQIEDLARSTVPISAFLIKFIAKYNFDFVLRYLLTIKRKCTIKGKPHIPSLLANLLFIKEILRLCDESRFTEEYREEHNNVEENPKFTIRFVNVKFPDQLLSEMKSLDEIDDEEYQLHRDFKKDKENCSKIVDILYDMNLPIEVYPEILEDQIKIDRLIDRDDIVKLFKSKNYKIRKLIAENPKCGEFKEFEDLLKDEEWEVRRKAVANPNATRFQYYNKLFPKEMGEHKMRIAKDPNATQFEEYKTLFSDKDDFVREYVAENPKATQFEEYKMLISDKQWYIRSSVAKNPNATQFEEYRNLFIDEEFDVRRSVAANPNAIKYGEYKDLIPKEYDCIEKIVNNPIAMRYQEYKRLFYDKNSLLLCEMAKSPYAVQFNEYERFFELPLGELQIVAANPEATKFEKYRNLFFRKENVILQAVASNPKATKFIEYKELFKSSSWIILKAIAKNPEATKFKEYFTLFDNAHIEVLEAIKENPNASQYKEYEDLFNKEHIAKQTDPTQCIHEFQTFKPDTWYYLRFQKDGSIELLIKKDISNFREVFIMEKSETLHDFLTRLLSKETRDDFVVEVLKNTGFYAEEIRIPHPLKSI